MKNPLIAATILAVASAAANAAIPNTPGWYSIPNTKIRSVGATASGISGAEGLSAVIDDWCGGAFDTKRNRLILWGGGHNGYYGNEIYTINLDNLTVSRITEPGLPPADYNNCLEAIANGTQPNSRHTYDGFCYMANADKLFSWGGSLACGPSGRSKVTWLFDFTAMSWSRPNPGGAVPGSQFTALGEGAACDYDPNTGKVFLHDKTYMYMYDPAANAYTFLPNSGFEYGTDRAATVVISPKRKRLYRIGGGVQQVYDISRPADSIRYAGLGSTGGSAIVNYGNPGLAYDPVGDQIVAWIDPGNTVYLLNLDTKVWSTVTYPGGPPASRYFNGIFKRFAYSAALDAFVVVNSVDTNAFTLRLRPYSGAERVLPAPECGLSVFPNPARDRARVSLSGSSGAVRAAVYDVSGALIRRISGDASAGLVLEFSGMAGGIYHLKAWNGRKHFSKNFLVIK